MKDRVKKSFLLLQRCFLGMVLLAIVFATGCGSSSDPFQSFRPIVFVHGTSGSAAQFESQAQRFLAHGYPKEYLVAYEHDTGTGTGTAEVFAAQADALDRVIDAVLAATGHKKVELIAHSRGTRVCSAYLAGSADRPAKVANYVAVDAGAGLPVGGARTLALWGDMTKYPASGEIAGATHINFFDQAHIELATSIPSFIEMYKFFNDGRTPGTTRIDPAPGATIEIAGRVAYFPQNTGALGVLEIYEINPVTAVRIGGAVATLTINATGNWGPLTVKKGATYEFAFEHAGAQGKHYFYREPNVANNYFIRLNTSVPGGGIGALLTRTPFHTGIVITRDKEFWGDQGANNDILVVDGASVATPLAARQAKRLSGLFLLDWGPDKNSLSVPPLAPDQKTDMSAVIRIFDIQAFLSGHDLFMPAATTPNRAIPCWLIPRGGGGRTQTINVPNWASSDVRVSVHFRDFVQ